MKPTPEQEAIAIAAAVDRRSMMISAYAGCAKTTSLVMAAEAAPKVPGLALAFNRLVGEELRQRLMEAAPNFAARTLNSLGFAALRAAHPQTRFEVKKDKLTTVLREVVGRTKLMPEQWKALRRLLVLAQARGIVPRGSETDPTLPLAADSEDEWITLCAGLWLPQEDCGFMIDLARAALRRNIEFALAGQLSFDDQLYCPVVLGGQWPKYPLVLIDEAQDLSPLMLAMLQRIQWPSGRLIAAGDRLQAIYAWRGASSSSMDCLAALRPEWQHLGLTLTWRCPQAVVARQQRHAPGYAARPEAPRGLVLEARHPQQLAEFVLRESGSRAILCRRNAPLVALALELLRDGRGIKLAGRDLAAGLIAQARRFQARSAEALRGEIADWRQSERQLLVANAADEEEIRNFDDRAACLEAIATGAKARDAEQLVAIIEKLFSIEGTEVVLSTIHRAKGLEWDAVGILWTPPGGGEQEANLQYVAETRTRNLLVLERQREGVI